MQNIIHIYGQKPLKTRQKLTIQDLRSIAFFNRIIKNYFKMLRIKSQTNV